MIFGILREARFYVCVLAICGVIPVYAGYAEEGDKPVPFSKEKPAGSELSLKQAIDADKKMEAIVSHKNDMEKDMNIQKKAEVSPAKMDYGILVKDNPDGLPAELVREDGTKVKYEYRTKDEVEIRFSEKEKTDEDSGETDEIVMRLLSDEISISRGPLPISPRPMAMLPLTKLQPYEPIFVDAPVWGPTGSKSKSEPIVPMVVIKPPAETVIPMDRQKLISYGMVDSKKIKKAFDELDSDMQELQRQYARVQGPGSNAIERTDGSGLPEENADKLYTKEKQEIVEKFYKKLASTLKKSSLSSAVMDGDSLDAVLILPKKR